MFQVNSNQVGHSIQHPVRSSYDAYYDHSIAGLVPQKSHTTRQMLKYPVGNVAFEDVSVWEALQGRPVRPSLPFGTFLFRAPKTVDEWRNRAYAGTVSVASALAIGNYFKIEKGTLPGIPVPRRRMNAFRHARKTFLGTLGAGLAWSTWVAHCKERSEAKVFYRITHYERFHAAIAMGIAAGLVEFKNSHPWYGQYSRLSIIFQRIQMFSIFYALIFGLTMYSFSANTIASRFGDPRSVVYNVAPWWWDQPMLPHTYFEGNSGYRAWNYRQLQTIERDIEVVDEYSPEFAKAHRKAF